MHIHLSILSVKKREEIKRNNYYMQHAIFSISYLHKGMHYLASIKQQITNIWLKNFKPNSNIQVINYTMQLGNYICQNYLLYFPNFVKSKQGRH